MVEKFRFVLRILMMACVASTLLLLSGCGSSTQDVQESNVSVAPDAIPLTSVRAELRTDKASVKPGESFRVGVLLTIPEGSHIYWKNPGESGLPTWVEWALTEGVEAGELQWPVPKRFVVEGWDEVSFGYESEVLLFMEVRTPESRLAAQSLTISANVYWLNCEEDGQCIPGKTELQLDIPLGVESELSRDTSLFEQHQQRVPIPLDAGAVPFSIEEGEGVSFIVRPHADIRIDFDGEGEAPDFFPDEGEAWTFERISGVASGNPEALRFTPPEDGTIASGVLKVPVYREDTETRQVFNILLIGE